MYSVLYDCLFVCFYILFKHETRNENQIRKTKLNVNSKRKNKTFAQQFQNNNGMVYLNRAMSRERKYFSNVDILCVHETRVLDPAN